jgi:hypothetical protein
MTRYIWSRIREEAREGAPKVADGDTTKYPIQEVFDQYIFSPPLFYDFASGELSMRCQCDCKLISIIARQMQEKRVFDEVFRSIKVLCANNDADFVLLQTKKSPLILAT